MEQPDSQLAPHHRRLTVLAVLGALIGLASLFLGGRTDYFDFFNPILRYLPDSIWKVSSSSAEGWAVGIMTLWALLERRTLRWWAGWGLAVAAGSLLPGLIKHTWFSSFPRPLELYKGTLMPIPGVEPAYWFSFPSGHTTAAAALAFYWAWTHPRPVVSALIFLWALLVGFSRMALHMHWWIDVVGGWCLGAALAALALRASQIDFVSLRRSKK